LYNAELGTVPALLLSEALVDHTSLVELSVEGGGYHGKMEWNAIALAVKKNPKLCRLNLNSCPIPPCLKENLCCLIREHSIESLALIDCWAVGENDVRCPIDLPDAFCHNSSLKELEIYEDCEDYGDRAIVTMETLRDIGQMLQGPAIMESKGFILIFEMSTTVARLRQTLPRERKERSI
jgi:hypothetical protein